ncbi:MAG: hypothetical protein K6F92_03730 [Lachnospiraceae bacterium]|nr:hypothetical protein [Lachnospiraceae bacterium]
MKEKLSIFSFYLKKRVVWALVIMAAMAIYITLAWLGCFKYNFEPDAAFRTNIFDFETIQVYLNHFLLLGFFIAIIVCILVCLDFQFGKSNTTYILRRLPVGEKNIYIGKAISNFLMLMWVYLFTALLELACLWGMYYVRDHQVFVVNLVGDIFDYDFMYMMFPLADPMIFVKNVATYLMLAIFLMYGSFRLTYGHAPILGIVGSITSVILLFWEVLGSRVLLLSDSWYKSSVILVFLINAAIIALVFVRLHHYFNGEYADEDYIMQGGETC